MLTWHENPPDLPRWAVLQWPANPAIAAWQRQIPAWVADTLNRLPAKGELRLLYLCARYPQMLEMLDKMPVLAWRLANANLNEHQLTQLFPRPRTEMCSLVGWPEDRHAIRFLQRLRLRSMDEQMLQQVDTCLLDTCVYQHASELPRINSMALTLAAHFPQLIGSTLHESLARQPCRPQQCQQMKALLQDAIELATWLREPLETLRQCRFLVEIEEHYAHWLEKGLKHLTAQAQRSDQKPACKKVGDPPRLPPGWRHVEGVDTLINCCRQTGHAWFTDASGWLVRPDNTNARWAARIECRSGGWAVTHARQTGNQLLDAEQQAQLDLLLARLNQSA